MCILQALGLNLHPCSWWSTCSEGFKINIGGKKYARPRMRTELQAVDFNTISCRNTPAWKKVSLYIKFHRDYGFDLIHCRTFQSIHRWHLWSLGEIWNGVRCGLTQPRCKPVMKRHQDVFFLSWSTGTEKVGQARCQTAERIRTLKKLTCNQSFTLWVSGVSQTCRGRGFKTFLSHTNPHTHTHV